MRQDRRIVLRLGALALIALASWAIAKYGYSKPDILSAKAPATLFSAERAYETLGRILGPERPHPADSEENAALRTRLLGELARLGIKATTYRAPGCNSVPAYDLVACATVTNIVAEVLPGRGRAVALVAHYDSVPAGPGASDDASGVASILEAARALKARHQKTLHPLIAVFTDGEEYGLLGAAAFLDNPQLRARVGAVINMEARGTHGRSLLFQTSPGAAPLIALYAKNVAHYATSSLYAEIYRLLPNDTDLTLFLRKGYPSLNFAFTENVAAYHTPLDRRSNLDLSTLQQHGENALGMAAALTQTDFAALKGDNAIYLDLFGAVLPQMPAVWALPLAIVCLSLLVGAAVVTRLGSRGWTAALTFPLVVIVGCLVVGFALHVFAQILSGQSDPSYAHPLALRIALMFGVLFVTLLAARMATGLPAAFAIWIWFAGLGLLLAVFLPGISPYFLFPASIASVALVVGRRRASPLQRILLLLPALAALIIWSALAASGESVMGLRLHPLFTVPAAFGLMGFVPILDVPMMNRHIWALTAGGLLACSIIAAAAAGLEPTYSETSPQRLNLGYFEDHASGRAIWTADGNAPLPQALRAAARFSAQPENLLPLARSPSYAAPAGAMRFSAPAIRVAVQTTAPRRVLLQLHASSATAQILLLVPKAAALKSVEIRGRHFTVTPQWANREQTIIACLSRDCRDATIGLSTAARKPFSVTLMELRFGLPPDGTRLVKARPKNAVPSQNGDVTVVAAKATVPGG